MEQEHVAQVAVELGLKARQVLATALLLDEGSTVPFICRYRKEMTGGLDEVDVTSVRDRLTQLAELDKRREAILKSLTERELLTAELEDKIQKAQNLTELEDIYLPFRPKRRTRATIAREKGLEPLANILFEQGDVQPDIEAEKYINKEKGVESTEDALSGARDIIAETVNEDKSARQQLRALYKRSSTIACHLVKGKEEEGHKFRDYFDWAEPAAKCPSHRILAMRRGENEGILSFRIAPDEIDAVEILNKLFIKNSSLAAEQVTLAVKDSYKRLLSLSMEAELRLALKKQADDTAIRVFADNLRQLLLAPPLGQRRVMALDPGFRSGCKLVCLDGQGKLLFTDTVFPHTSKGARQKAAIVVMALAEKFKIEAIAIGNGTAGRETEAFVRGLGLPKDIQVVLVNESGASVYSASEVARNEFPDYDATVRGSASIGRRLMDPLAELVKIDPKSIGVGQYQHDVDQSQLKNSLDDIVMSCVNAVGVEVNTASKELLAYVSGLGPVLAGNIVEYRNENGPFSTRKKLKDVPRLGPKAFEQAAGFLRIMDAKNPLDRSAVHPESYHAVDAMAHDLDTTVAVLIESDEMRQKVELDKYVTDTIGLPTLEDIIGELARPGRDPRDEFEAVEFAEGINEMKDLLVGMRLDGVITNITNFGAFVDIGVHQDGLVHISQMADRFVKNPAEFVKVGQKVNVGVLAVDIPRSRIALTMKKDHEAEIKNLAEGGRKKPQKKSENKPSAKSVKPNEPKFKKGANTSMADALRAFKKGPK